MGLLGVESLVSLVDRIKSKMRSLNGKMIKRPSKKPYVKMEKSSSIKLEIMKQRTRRLIDETLKAADNPGKTSIAS